MGRNVKEVIYKIKALFGISNRSVIIKSLRIKAGLDTTIKQRCTDKWISYWLVVLWPGM